MPALKNKMVMLMAAFACASTLGACTGQGYLKDEIDDATGAYTITAENAAQGSIVASLGGGLDIKENQVLVLTPDLTKGSLQVELIDDANETVLDVTASGQGSSTHAIDPADYTISVTCNENGTTGTLVIAPTNKDEVAL